MKGCEKKGVSPIMSLRHFSIYIHGFSLISGSPTFCIQRKNCSVTPCQTPWRKLLHKKKTVITPNYTLFGKKKNTSSKNPSDLNENHQKPTTSQRDLENPLQPLEQFLDQEVRLCPGRKPLILFNQITPKNIKKPGKA